MLAPLASKAPAPSVRPADSTPAGEPRLLVQDVADLPPSVFDDVRLERALSLALAGHADGAMWIRHNFAPSGLSLVGVSARCRVALHTWPERHALSLDLYGTAPELERLFSACLDALLAP